MGGLTAEELASAREEAEGYLPDLVQIHRLTRVSDNAGGWSETWAPHGDPIPARLDFGDARYGAGETGVPAQAGVLDAGILKVPTDADIQEADRVEIQGRLWEISLVRLASWGVLRWQIWR